MKKNKKLTLFIAFISIYFCIFSTEFSFSIPVNVYPEIHENEIQGSKIIRNEKFTGEGLFGYIDGGADIFLEYGFQEVLVQELKIDSMNFKIDMYQMNNCANAFGIFSVFCSKFKSIDSTFDYCSSAKMSFQFAKNKFYVSVTTDADNQNSQEILSKIAKLIVSKIPDDDFDLPDFFKKNFSDYSTMKFINGKLGMQNLASDLSDYFENYSGFKLWLINSDTIDCSIRLSMISFKTKENSENFIKTLKLDECLPKNVSDFPEKGKYVCRSDTKSLIFIEFSGKKDILSEKLKNLINKQ
jgi:hypothetical protein